MRVPIQILTNLNYYYGYLYVDLQKPCESEALVSSLPTEIQALSQI